MKFVWVLDRYFFAFLWTYTLSWPIKTGEKKKRICLLVVFLRVANNCLMLCLKTKESITVNLLFPFFLFQEEIGCHLEEERLTSKEGLKRAVEVLLMTKL